jgi:hypothetical protein
MCTDKVERKSIPAAKGDHFRHPGSTGSSRASHTIFFVDTLNRAYTMFIKFKIFLLGSGPEA